MTIDSKLTAILSDFFLDIAKAFFIATFITPSITGISTTPETLLILTRGLLNVILFLLGSWQLAKLEERL